MQNRYSIAALVLIIVFLLFWAIRFKHSGKAASKNQRNGQNKINLPTWVDIDLASGLWIYPFFFVIWLGGNILLGNMMGIQAIINFINTLNTSGDFTLSPWIIAAIGLAPSTAQWWIKQFAPPSDKTYWVTWGIIGLDVGLNTFGFWSLADMPTDFKKFDMNHFAVLSIFMALAAFVNIYCENMVHDALHRIMKWLQGKSMKGAIA